ncbi:MAG: hypothetical protein NVSMB6_14440 [Burkholderiaceae bacterium]
MVSTINVLPSGLRASDCAKPAGSEGVVLIPGTSVVYVALGAAKGEIDWPVGNSVVLTDPNVTGGTGGDGGESWPPQAASTLRADRAAAEQNKLLAIFSPE